MTAYYFSATERFTECLELLLQFVTTPYFTEESVTREQGIIGQEIGMNEDNPDTRLFENLMAAMYENHKISEPILGTRSSISQITPKVLTEVHKAFYRPDNLLLCVVGDVDPEAVYGLACKMTEEMPSVQVAEKPQLQEAMTCKKKEMRAGMDVAMPMFQLGFKCEPLGTGEESVRRELIGDLAAEMLFGESSTLYLRLYEQGVIDSSFGGGFETVKGMAMLTASGDSFTPEAVQEAILQQAQKLLAEGIDEEDFMRCKRSALGRRMRDLDSFDSLCFRICAYHFSCFDYFDFPDVYASIRQSDLLEFIRRVVIAERCCLSVIEPITKEET
jgi:predicted Zn-dependent peptidase